MTFIKRNIRCAIVNTPGKVDHDSVWDYPIEALRESLANAVCHRDYGFPHDIQLRIYDDSVAISSPGQLPFDWTDRSGEFLTIYKVRGGDEVQTGQHRELNEGNEGNREGKVLAGGWPNSTCRPRLRRPLGGLRDYTGRDQPVIDFFATRAEANENPMVVKTTPCDFKRRLV